MFPNVFGGKLSPKKRLPSLNDILELTQYKDRIYLGRKQIEIDKIIGSEGRYSDFDDNFLPTNDSMRHRLLEIRKLLDEGHPLPPISVFKIDDYYFVRDGNHRVAVGKSRGQISIDAEVTEYIINVPITKKLTPNDRLIIKKHANFLKITGLERFGRSAIINLNNPQYYDTLIEIIEQFILSENKKSNSSLSFQEGATLWYHKVFLPFAEDAYRTDLLHRFNNRTTGDLYVSLQTNWKKIKKGIEESNHRLAYMSLGENYLTNLPSVSWREINILWNIYSKNLANEDNSLLTHHITIVVLNVLIYVSDPKKPKVVIVKRKYHPSEMQWSFPITMLRNDEEIKESSIRCQSNVLGIKNPYPMMQFCIQDQKNRYPFSRYIAIGMLGFIFDQKRKLKFMAGNLADSVNVCDLLDMPDLVFDHYDIYTKALGFIAKNTFRANIFEKCMDNTIPLNLLVDTLKTINKKYYQHFANR
ncbi:MAG: NUDIX hydrolase [SAR324 cluster bacterium]|nr:NUDIX hydrolase [SAR324 cluster bacterium]